MNSGSAPGPEGPVNTSSKVDFLRAEIQRLVGQGIESPLFELTRECSLASDDRKSQADFAKTVQGISNAYPREERVYVVGADQKGKRFYGLGNERDFDPANLRQVLEKYIEPLPNFEAYVLETQDHVKFAVVVLASEQPRPILVKTSIQAADGKTWLLHKGDIWIKKRTGLDRASRDDLEAMFETRIETESERRAAKRIADVRDGMEANLRLQVSSERRIPSEDLIFGPDAQYKAYIQQLLANQDELRFRMLITTLRDLLVEKWHSVDAYDPAIASALEQAAHIRSLSQHEGYAEAASKLEEPAAKIAEHLQAVFYPALRRLVHAGLLLIKHDLDTGWMGLVVDLLLEAFGESPKLLALPETGADVGAGRPTRGTVALEVLLGGRALASYTVRMERFGYLPALLKKYTICVGSSDVRVRKPFLLWPLRMNVPGNYRIAYEWAHMVQPYWLEFFGSEVSYLRAACQLEFIFHLNSYLATENPDARSWLEKYEPGSDFLYWYRSDLWRYPLDSIVPLAERVYENLPSGPNASFLVNISIAHGVLQKAFQPNQQSVGREQQVFVAYLRALRGWQAQAAHSVNRFPYQVHWGPVLGPLINAKNG